MKEAFSVLLVAALVALPGCDLFGFGPKAFPWIEAGHQMTYDFEAGPDPFVDPNTGFVYTSAEDVLRIVIEEPDHADFEFKKKSPSTNEWDTHHRDGAITMISNGFYGFPGPVRTEDGIRVEYRKACDDPGWGEGDYASAVRVPADPEEGARYRLRACGGEVTETYEAVAAGLTLTVPAGTFENVFTLRNRADRQTEYWSEEEGLLKVERYAAADGRLLGAYVLASKNF